MAKAKYQATIQAAVPKAGRTEIDKAFIRLATHWQVSSWLGLRNRYRTHCIAVIDKDLKAKRKPKARDMAEYIAASVPLHTYDGWAYGNALWSTHDSGMSWSAADSPPGQVTQLESWGDYVYAGVSSPVVGDDTATLYRSPTGQDAWKALDVTPRGLASVQSLTAAKGVVGLIDGGTGHSVLYLSANGVSWHRERDACPTGFDPEALSTASRTIDPLTTTGSLWVTCTNLTSTVIRFTDTTALGSWHSVLKDSFPRTVSVAARTPTTAFVAGAGVTGITMVSASKPPTPVPATGYGAPLFFGFTNETNGYLLDSNGTIVSTTDGGATWTPYTVSDTQP